MSISPIQAFALGADSVYLSKRPLPDAPDGKYDWQTTAESHQSKDAHSSLTNVIKEIGRQKTKGAINPDPTIIKAFLDKKHNSDRLDDRLNVLGKGMTILSRLPSDSPLAKDLSDAAIANLYDTLPHPPAAYLGSDYVYRKADGSGNNVQQPEIGQAGRPYARSVQGTACVDPSSLPDPGLVFDSLLKRRGEFQKHTNGVSSLIFAFASLVTHSLFRTKFNPADPNALYTNEASSYLDLSPVYGDSQYDQDRVRNKALGRGYLYPDTFSEERLLFIPPAASALLVVFSRNHNYIAEKLLKINEKGLWSDPPPQDPIKLALQDEQIFQTARLVNGGHFMSMIMGDYVAGFLGLGDGNAWNLPAFDPITLKDGTEVGRGQGNHCSAEFNVLYRWHPTTSAEDEKWTEALFADIGKPYDEMTVQDFGKKFVKEIFEAKAKEPKDRVFGGMQRGSDGRFNDDEVARILHDATSHAAGTYGGQNTPHSLRVVEILGISQARRWGLCTMNEFREYLGLKPFATFKEWNSNEKIWKPAQRLYKHVSNLELYVGLQCEEVMPLTGGLRFTAGYTMTRAVLGDAISLIRGDRYYTTDFTPANLTTWGFQDCKRDPNNGGFGGELPKLLARTLPRNYPYNSVYTCFPFFTPEKMKGTLERIGNINRYKLERPIPARIPKVANTFTAIKTLFNDPIKFNVIYDLISPGSGYNPMLACDDPAKHEKNRSMVLHAVFPTPASLDEYRSWYKNNALQRIQEKSWSLDGAKGIYIDIINDVINPTSVHWAADRLCGIPLKTKDDPAGLYTVQEVYEMFATLFSCKVLACDVDNENGYSLREKTLQAGGVIAAMISKSMLEVAPSSSTSGVFGIVATIHSYLWPAHIQSRPWFEFMKRLSDTGRPVNELTADIISLAIGSSVNYAQAASQIIDFYLENDRAGDLNEIKKLAKLNDSASFELLQGYVREGMRLSPQYSGLWRQSTVEATIQQGPNLPPLQLKPGDRVWASFKNAHRNPADFPNPNTVDPRRPKSSYAYLNGTGYHGCPGVTYTEQTIAETVKAVFSLKNVRRAPGAAGKLKKFTQIVNETEDIVYIDADGQLTTWPTSLTLVYDP